MKDFRFENEIAILYRKHVDQSSQFDSSVQITTTKCVSYKL